ncbi:coil containing protein [Vibrio phage 489E54-1]|nr:coil containing protein [Vibrio phage 489E54-1]
MTVKQFALGGVNEVVEFGKDGHQLDASNSGYIEIKNTDGTLIRVKGAAATASDEFVTKLQLDAVNALAGGYLSFSYDASANISQLSGQGSGDAGAILYGDTYKVGTSGTFLGLSAQVGDLVTALVADADVADNTASNTDWMLIEIRTASDLADGSSTDHSSGKLIVKDLGVTTDKLGALSVTEPKMADDSVPERSIIDRSVTGPKVGLATLTNENHANNEIAKIKLAAAVQTTLTNADTEYNTRTPNVESIIGASVDLDTDAVVPAHSNYATATNLHGQIAQLDTQIKNDDDEAALRKVSATHDGGAQNVGSAIASGRVVTTVMVTPVTVANGANCVMSIGVSGQTAKYVASADIDLYEGTTQVFHINAELSSSEQIVATVTQGTATQGSFLVTVQHG